MKRSILIFTILSSIILSDTIQRDRTALRSGPGAWFPKLYEIQKGAEVKVLQAEGNWVKVKLGGELGYISAKALKGKSSNPDVFASMAMQNANPQVSKSAISAAVKGFADRFSRKLELDPDVIAYRDHSAVDFSGYDEFVSQTIDPKAHRKVKKKLKLKKLPKDQPFTFSEEGSGLAIAAKLKTLGLVSDPGLNRYVNYVGSFVAEQSHGYDIPFEFFILDIDGVNGYACPGGIIFITRGALDQMQSEAELACFLGHEISHVVFRHGMKEMEERKEMIMADNVFDEMSMELKVSSDIKLADDELDDLALDSYETIFHGRLSNYEEEADEIGLLYAARAGYEPKAMISLLKRIGSSKSVSGAEHYSKSQNLLRIDRLKKYLKDKTFKGKYQQHKQRFAKNS